ncbi:MAG: hypothetical protein AAB197_05825, partial [Deltaproteobacteria bacterium]
MESSVRSQESKTSRQYAVGSRQSLLTIFHFPLSIFCLLLTVYCLLSTVFTGCAKKEDTIKIGVAGPMTGYQAKMGMDLKNGVELA